MGTWNNLQEGFTVNERLPDTLVDVAVWHVFNRAPQLYRQTPQIKGATIFGVDRQLAYQLLYLGLEFLVLESISIPKVLGPF